MRQRRRVLTAAIGLGITLAACSAGNDGAEPSSTSTTATTATDSPPTSAPPDLAAARVSATLLAELERPTALATRPGTALPGADTLYVLEKSGRIRTLNEDRLDDAIALDITGDVGAEGNEQGLLGLAFSPDGAKVYVYFTDRDGDARIVEYAMAGDTIDADSARDLLRIDEPQANHNGGQLAFGPDGLLYIGVGDGGAANDDGPGHVAGGNAQSPDVLLGKILRIDPEPGADAPYTIPADNPFAAGGGEPEIFALGLRNPWRFSFDRETGDLWIGDVGQNEWEEIDWLATGTGAGANFGWNRREGTHEFTGDAPDGAIPPVFEYAHADGNCSVTGGYVYRGTAIPALGGAYVFADYCAGALRALTADAGSLTAERFLDVDIPTITSFGESTGGELYVASDEGGVYRLDPA